MRKLLSSISVDVELQENGKFDIYIATEGSSGEHYPDITADEIGAKVSDLVECLAEAL